MRQEGSALAGGLPAGLVPSMQDQVGVDGVTRSPGESPSGTSAPDASSGSKLGVLPKKLHGRGGGWVPVCKRVAAAARDVDAADCALL